MNKPSLNGASNLSKNGINQSFKDTKDNLSNYISILRANLLPIILITLASIIITLIYVFNAKDIYKSYSTIKINRPQGSVLSSSLIPEFQDFITDRYISNEIEVLKSYKIREKVAENMIDTFKINQDKDKFYYLFNHSDEDNNSFVSVPALTDILSSIVKIDQKRGLDVVDIVVESPSRYEAMLVANLYATVYQSFSLELSREELTTLTRYLNEEKDNKFKDLAKAELDLEDYQKNGGLILLDAQVKNLVENISQLEAQKNAANIELSSKEKEYNSLSTEIARIDPTLVDFMNGKIDESYISKFSQRLRNLNQKEI
ncbi:MAG: hypothetical protein IPP52_18325 [Ignavibacteria bacterium]|nr:hypothetical protein [Ignavibacteria bacterium]